MGGSGDKGSLQPEVLVSEEGWPESETPSLGFNSEGPPLLSLSPQGDRGLQGAVGETGEKVSAAWGLSGP